MDNGGNVLVNGLGALPQQVAPAPLSVWQHDPAQEEKYGGDYLVDLAERCDALIQEQAALIGYIFAPGTDNVDLDAGNDPTVKPRLADLKRLNRKKEELADEIFYVDNLMDIPERYVIAYKARSAAHVIAQRETK